MAPITVATEPPAVVVNNTNTIPGKPPYFHAQPFALSTESLRTMRDMPAQAATDLTSYLAAREQLNVQIRERLVTQVVAAIKASSLVQSNAPITVQQRPDGTMLITAPVFTVTAKNNDTLAEVLSARITQADTLMRSEAHAKLVGTLSSIIAETIGRGHARMFTGLDSDDFLAGKCIVIISPPLEEPVVNLPAGLETEGRLIALLQQAAQRGDESRDGVLVARQGLLTLAKSTKDPFIKFVASLNACIAPSDGAIPAEALLLYRVAKGSISPTDSRITPQLKAAVDGLQRYLSRLPSPQRDQELRALAATIKPSEFVEALFAIDRVLLVPDDVITQGKKEFLAALAECKIGIAQRERALGRALHEKEIVESAAEYLHGKYRFTYASQHSVAKGYASHQLDCDTATFFIMAVGELCGKDFKSAWYLRAQGVAHVVPLYNATSVNDGVMAETLVDPRSIGRVAIHDQRSLELWLSKPPSEEALIIPRDRRQTIAVLVSERVSTSIDRLTQLEGGVSVPPIDEIPDGKLRSVLDEIMTIGSNLDPLNPVLLSYRASPEVAYAAARAQFGKEGERIFRKKQFGVNGEATFRKNR